MTTRDPDYMSCFIKITLSVYLSQAFCQLFFNGRLAYNCQRFHADFLKEGFTITFTWLYKNRLISRKGCTLLCPLEVRILTVSEKQNLFGWPSHAEKWLHRKLSSVSHNIAKALYELCYVPNTGSFLHFYKAEQYSTHSSVHARSLYQLVRAWIHIHVLMFPHNLRPEGAVVTCPVQTHHMVYGRIFISFSDIFTTFIVG